MNIRWYNKSLRCIYKIEDNIVYVYSDRSQTFLESAWDIEIFHLYTAKKMENSAHAFISIYYL